MGYLAAGLAVGPFGFGFFDDPQSIIHVAELGVVLFLFIIGLEMQPARLWSMRGEIFGLGLLQVALAMAALVWVGLALGYPAVASFVAGTGFVLTSTAIVMQMLEERAEMGLPKGRKIIANMVRVADLTRNAFMQGDLNPSTTPLAVTACTTQAATFWIRCSACWRGLARER